MIILDKGNRVNDDRDRSGLVQDFTRPRFDWHRYAPRQCESFDIQLTMRNAAVTQLFRLANPTASPIPTVDATTIADQLLALSDSPTAEQIRFLFQTQFQQQDLFLVDRDPSRYRFVSLTYRSAHADVNVSRQISRKTDRRRFHRALAGIPDVGDVSLLQGAVGADEIAVNVPTFAEERRHLDIIRQYVALPPCGTRYTLY